jgi:NAD(P)-dependent dehydrogenase (short-subunit alcohol dehydrogenase family)
MGRFDDKVVLVVGAASGIGRETAKRFSEEGATVVVGDVSPAVDETLELLGGDGKRGFSAQVDITSFDDCRAIVDRTVSEFGRVDVLSAISGVVQNAAQVADLAEAEWDRVLGVNLKGYFFLTKAVASEMQKQRAGSIILTASFWGRKGFAYYAAYCASKAGVISLTQTLSEEMAPYGVRVNSVAPGMIMTGMHEKALREEAAERQMSYEEFRDSEWSKIPLGKAGDPVDIANAHLFLASDDAKYITGASLDVNGGVQLR